VKHKLLFLFCLSLSFLCISCAAHTAVEPEPSHIQFYIQPGEKLRVVTKDNKETEFIVKKVTEDALIGKNQKVMFEDIIELDEVTGENVKFDDVMLFTLKQLTITTATIFTQGTWLPRR